MQLVVSVAPEKKADRERQKGLEVDRTGDDIDP